MEFKYISQELIARGLTPIVLHALQPDDNEYSILLNQYAGTVVATQEFIGNSGDTHTLAIRKFEAFLNVALTESYDLVISPEYSCPWDVINSMASKKTFPSEGKLWVLGCESIRPSELSSLADTNREIEWIFETAIFEQQKDKIFLDPVCYMFKAQKNGKAVDVCVVQFKYQHMSVHLAYREKDYLIEGSISYIFQNPGSTVSLVTLICSEALNFDFNKLVNMNLDKLIILHVQMNLDPRHHILKKYRNDVFNAASDEIEVICLNWAKGTDILGNKIDFAGSAYYIKSEKPVLTDNRLDQNQSKGIFYCHWTPKRSHVFFIVADECLTGFKTHKASQALATGPLRRRDGPNGINTYRWHEENYIVGDFPDAFRNHCDSLQCDLSPLSALGHIDRERLLILSSGINLTSRFHDVLHCSFFSINDTEIINRVTYIYEPDSSAKQNRDDYLMRMRELILCFTTNAGIPEELKSLVTDSKITYNANNTFSNVYSTTTGSTIGTILYLGASSLPNAKAVYDNVKKQYLNTVQNIVKRGMPAILVWYVHGSLKTYYESTNLIDADVDAYGTDITKES